MRFTKPKKAIGIDIGTHSVKTVQMSRTKGRLLVEAVRYALVDRNQVNADPVAAHADAVTEALSGMTPGQALLVAALPGQTAVIRYPRLPDMPVSQIPDAIQAEAGQNIPYDLAEVYLDSYLLEQVTEGNEKLLRVLLVAAKEAVVDSRVRVLSSAGLSLGVLTVDSLALADAAEACAFFTGEESVALINIGLSSASIHFTRDGISSFIRDVNWGAREFIQAIAKSRRCEYEEAEQALTELAGEEKQAEAAAEEEIESVGEPIKQEEEVFSSPLDPLEDEFTGGGSSKSSLGGSVFESGAGGERGVSEVVAPALDKLISEVRRSFDYYEHQLYERPVEKLILSGGIAHFPILRERLSEELGVPVEVANPLESALAFGNGSADPLREQPAQYMVAVGLAARGMADL